MHSELNTKKRFIAIPALIGLLTTGGAALGLEIIAYSQFSFLYGYVLKYLGLFISVFMAGTAAGAFLSDFRKFKTGLFPVYSAEFGFIALSILVWFAPKIFMSGPNATLPAIYLGINLVLGLFTGFEFVLLCHVHRFFKGPGSKPGFLYSIDNLGAVIIALLFIYTVPVLGLKKSTLIILFSKLISCFILLISYRSQRISD